MPSTPRIDPPDTATSPDCNWCGTDPRAAAFCSKACEDESRATNGAFDDLDPDDRSPQHDRDLALLLSRGFR